MRTQDEIVARIEKRKANDVLSFEVPQYVSFLNFDTAKPYLVNEAVSEEWNKRDLSNIRDVMTDYMEFAWDKANGCRGISAGRSMMHYQAWLWLEGEWTETEIDALDDYEYYGKPQLIKICEHLGLDASKWDDGERTN